MIDKKAFLLLHMPVFEETRKQISKKSEDKTTTYELAPMAYILAS
ncbi:hypothetical protein PLUTE_b0945 [Pseudoalteromonas luteoviolacea DSM 6061]|nr:hypothetical protein [Pseudoalteromonas luteoviolacea DSM 6061]